MQSGQYSSQVSFNMPLPINDTIALTGVTCTVYQCTGTLCVMLRSLASFPAQSF